MENRILTESIFSSQKNESEAGYTNRGGFVRLRDGEQPMMERTLSVKAIVILFSLILTFAIFALASFIILIQVKNDIETIKTKMVVNEINDEENMTQATNTTQQPNVVDEDVCEVDGLQQCFKAVIHDKQDVRYMQAERICVEEGGLPADIDSYDQSMMIFEYLRKLLPDSVEYMNLWIGMKYNQTSGTLSLRNGTESSYSDWYSDNPLKEAGLDHVGLHVDEGQSVQWNGRASRKTYGVLCQI